MGVCGYHVCGYGFVKTIYVCVCVPMCACACVFVCLHVRARLGVRVCACLRERGRLSLLTSRILNRLQGDVGVLGFLCYSMLSANLVRGV